MSTCFDKNMSSCLYASMLICTDTFMIGCSYVNMLRWSHVFKFTCHDDRVLPCLHALMITWPLDCMPSSSFARHFDDYLLLFWNASMFDAYMHWYLHVWYPHTYAHTWMIKCQLAQRLKWTCSTMFVHSNALKIMLECWDNREIRGMYTWVL